MICGKPFESSVFQSTTAEEGGPVSIQTIGPAQRADIVDAGARAQTPAIQPFPNIAEEESPSQIVNNTAPVNPSGPAIGTDASRRILLAAVFLVGAAATYSYF